MLSGWAVVIVATTSVVLLTSAVPSGTGSNPPSGQVHAGDVTTQAEWTLLYTEDFSTPLNDAVAPWVWDAYSAPAGLFRHLSSSSRSSRATSRK